MRLLLSFYCKQNKEGVSCRSQVLKTNVSSFYWAPICKLRSRPNERRRSASGTVAQDVDTNNEACEKSSAKSPNPVSVLRLCSRTDVPRPRITTTAARWHKRRTDKPAEESRQVNRQTNRVGAMPQRAMSWASASPLQHTEQTGGRGARCLSTDWHTAARSPLSLTHTHIACNEWRRGCLPQGR